MIHEQSPSFPPRASRPKLRIVTTAPEAIRRSIFIYPPDPTQHVYRPLVKTAPLYRPSTVATAAYLKNDNMSGAARECGPDIGGLVVQVESHVSTDPPISPRLPKASGISHKQRLSDKFRSMISHIVRREPAAIQNPLDGGRTPAEEGSIQRHLFTPVRLARSPGTASFMIHRHLPSLPVSPCLTISSTDHIAALRMQISHFSNPTTVTTTSSSAGRSVSNSLVEVVSPSLSPKSKTSMLVRGRRASDKWNGRRWGSMPDLRLFQVVWERPADRCG
jgi:hypothetical protein